MSIDMLISKYSNTKDEQDIEKIYEEVTKLNTQNQSHNTKIVDEITYVNTTMDVGTFLIQEDDMLI